LLNMGRIEIWRTKMKNTGKNRWKLQILREKLT
jgi:hypothetical protein